MKKEDPNPRQDTQIALLKQRLESFEKTFDKGFKDLAGKIDHWDDKLDQVVRSFNDDKQHAKFYMDEKFVEKKDFKPIKNIYDKFINFCVGFVLIVGTIAISIFIFFKDKLHL